jgi:hypothetical protein
LAKLSLEVPTTSITFCAISISFDFSPEFYRSFAQSSLLPAVRRKHNFVVQSSWEHANGSVVGLTKRKLTAEP